MEILKLLRFHSPPRADKTTGRWILAGLFVLGVLALAGCGASATTPRDVVEAYIEAVKAGDAEAALALFTDDALIVAPVGSFHAKESIRQYIDGEVKWWAEGYECSELFNVQETEETLDGDERCELPAGVWEGHHTVILENGKIKSWTQSGKLVE